MSVRFPRLRLCCSCMAVDRSGLVSEISAWLATLAIDSDTLAQSLDDTIVPGEPTTNDATTGKHDDRTESSGRAVAMLHEVARLSPTSTAQLQQGEVIAEGGM